MSKTSRSAEAVQEIEVLLSALKPDQRLPSMRQLMGDLGVSLVTLNRALDDLERRGLVERRPGSGLYARSDVGVRVAVICDPRMVLLFGSSPFYSLMLQALLVEGEAEGLHLSFHFTQVMTLAERDAQPHNSFDTSFRKLLRSGACRGALTLGLSGPQARTLESWGVPSVAFGGSGTCQAAMNEEHMVSRGLEFLKQAGCRRAAFWGYDDPAADFFVEEARRLGMETQRATIPIPRADDPIHGEPQAARGFRHAMARLSAGPQADGLLLLDDAYTQGVLMAMGRLGLAPSKDLQIATHAVAGSPVLWGWEPHLFLISVEPRDLARTMVKVLASELGLGVEPPPSRQEMIVWWRE
jgi:DNA-binding LacI/PurR family transcriptional regulator